MFSDSANAFGHTSNSLRATVATSTEAATATLLSTWLLLILTLLHLHHLLLLLHHLLLLEEHHLLRGPLPLRRHAAAAAARRHPTLRAPLRVFARALATARLHQDGHAHGRRAAAHVVPARHKRKAMFCKLKKNGGL